MERPHRKEDSLATQANNAVDLPQFILDQVEKKVDEHREKLIELAKRKLLAFDLDDDTGVMPSGKGTHKGKGKPKPLQDCPVPGCKNKNFRSVHGFYCADHMDSKEHAAWEANKGTGPKKAKKAAAAKGK